MPSFRTLLVVAPATRVDKPLDFHFLDGATIPPVHVHVDPLTAPDTDGKPYQTGLRLIVHLEARSFEDAVHQARGHADGVLAAMSYVSGFGLPHSVPMSVLQTGATPVEKRFVQFFDLPSPQSSQGDVVTAVLFRALTNLTTLNEELRSRVLRALHDLAFGQRELEPIDRFLHFWMGLEALDRFLQQDLKPQPVYMKCSKCHHKTKIPTTSGIRAFMVESMTDGLELYRRMGKLRVNLVHGVTETDQGLITEAESLAPQARRVLRRALSRYLGIKEGELKGVDATRTNQMPTRGAIAARLSPGDKEHYGPPNEEPHFDITHVVKSTRVRDDGRVDIELEQKAEPRMAEGVRCIIDGIGALGEFSEVRLQGVVLKNPIDDQGDGTTQA